MVDKDDSWDFGNMSQFILVSTMGVTIFLVFLFNIQQGLIFNIIGLIYEVVGFVLILFSTKNKIKISESDLKRDKIIEIDFITKRKLWEFGIVLIVFGLGFQLFAIVMPLNPTFDS